MPATQPVSGVLGPLEAEVMTVLWSRGEPMTVREVRADVNAARETPLAYTTVMTVLARLAEKGILSRVREGRGYRYEPLVGDTAGIAVREVVRGFGEAAIAGFVDEARADPKLLRRLRALLAEEP
ncbi:BlaI/MecI/CopY family transcriptional regulator [Iamia sp.]|uniref:BlaI/MecI/CopY family transcriptional regulator n=1 Tax=Iamia sp. TaxID=2722710 RepID=UPI002B7BA594|nr:BlaI/MecI/CopY family transcriptional regulator [Iamia sp.]HXH59017.1 BlaI/MecI/CopY family transcriptional regulator [Iamia sp.]